MLLLRKNGSFVLHVFNLTACFQSHFEGEIDSQRGQETIYLLDTEGKLKWGYDQCRDDEFTNR